MKARSSDLESLRRLRRTVSRAQTALLHVSKIDYTRVEKNQATSFKMGDKVKSHRHRDR